MNKIMAVEDRRKTREKLESFKLPDEEVARQLFQKFGVKVDAVTLWRFRTGKTSKFLKRGIKEAIDTLFNERRLGQSLPHGTGYTVEELLRSISRVAVLESEVRDLQRKVQELSKGDH